MATLSSYLQKSKIKHNTTKTKSVAFHLYNKKARHELKISVEGQTLLFCQTNLHVIKLDRTLTCRKYLVSLHKKLTSRVGLLRRLAGSRWGASAKVLCTSLALVHFIAVHCASVWCHSAYARLINKPINDALCIMSGCLRSTTMNNLLVQAGIQPTELRHRKAMLSLACSAQEP